jgi:hypothetical protein
MKITKKTHPSKRRVKDNIKRGAWVPRWLIVDYDLSGWMRRNFLFTKHDFILDRFMGLVEWRKGNTQ